MTTPNPGRASVAIIGGGIAGMAAAYRCKQRGLIPTVFEARDRVGGRIWSVRKGDFLMDAGTAVYLGTYREAIALITELGLLPEMSERLVIGTMPRDGILHHFDYSRPIHTALTTRALSWSSKLRAGRLAMDTFRNRASLGYSDYTMLADIDTETIKDYCDRVLNAELRDYVAAPLVSGTWVADDADTSVALLYWTIRNMLVPQVYNLNSGVMGLPVEIAKHVDVRYGCHVENVTRTATTVEVTSAGRVNRFDGCIVATTAQPAMQIYPQMDDVTRDLYSTTRYRRLGSICLGLSRRPDDPGTYLLCAPKEDPDTIAVIADHIKAPCRAPEGKGLLTVLLSHEYLERSEHLSDDDVLDYAFDRAMKYHTDVRPDQLEEHLVVRWPESVPTLDKGRFKRIARYTGALDRSSRVQFASDLDRIPGLNGALVSGQDAAGRLATVLMRPNR